MPNDPHREHDDADAIEMAEHMREAARAARGMFNAYMAEGFTEAQSLSLTRSWIHAAAGGADE